jgi:hypothetical protein
MWCKAAAGDISITPSLATSGVKEGERGAIILSTSTKSIKLQGEANFSEATEAIELTAILSNPQELAAIFRKTGSLKVVVPGNTTILPLTHEAQRAFAEFRRRCLF